MGLHQTRKAGHNEYSRVGHLSPSPPPKDHRPTASKFANASYDLAAHVPTYRKHAEGLQLANGAPPRASSLAYSTDLIPDERFPRPPIGPPIPSNRSIPAPLSSGSHVLPGGQYYSSQALTLVPQLPLYSDVPQPLKFGRATAMPMTPPMSNAGSSEGGIRDSMQSLNIGAQQPAPLRLPMSTPNLPRRHYPAWAP